MRPVQIALAGRIVFPLDQAKLAHQAILRHLRERRQDAGMDRRCVYVLVAIVKKRLGLDLSLHSMLQILSVTPFEKIPLIQILTDTLLDEEMLLSRSQLNLF